MKTYLSITLLLLLVSCDSGRTRAPNTLNSGLSSDSIIIPTNGENGSDPTNGTNGTTGNNGSNGTSLGAGYESCDFNISKHFAQTIGWLGVCQHSTVETSIVVKPDTTDTIRTCLIPTYKDGSGSSTYLGQPQCFMPQANIVVNGTLFKTRAGFTHLPLNGLMVIKENAITPYFTCMNAYVNFIDPLCPQGEQTPVYQRQVPPYNWVNCDQLARAAMTAICSSFKSSYPYIDVRLKL